MLTKRFTRILLPLAALALWIITPALAQEHPAEHPKAKAEHPKEMAPDAVKAAPKLYKILLENDRVRVLEHQGKPGEKAAMHSHPAYVAYIMSSGKAKFTSSDGKTQEIEATAGQVLWSEGETHAVENAGSTDLRVIIVELKAPKKMEPAKNK